VIVFLAWACGARPVEVEAAPAPVEAAPVLAEATHGSWISASCGARSWARTLSFEDQGRFTGQDLVSPCPKGTTCIWSGVIERAGSWTSVQGRVQLALDQPGSMPVAEPMAAWVEPRGQQLVDDLGCLYSRVDGAPE
jgi:hypothetical protein